MFDRVWEQWYGPAMITNSENLPVSPDESLAKQRISHTVAHYLKAVHECHEEHGYSRVTDIARKLNVKKSSVSIQIHRLKKRGLISIDANKHIHLSSAGKQLSNRCFVTKEILFNFFHHVLRAPKAEADNDACRIEHQLSASTAGALHKLVTYMEQHPELIDCVQDTAVPTLSPSKYESIER